MPGNKAKRFRKSPDEQERTPEFQAAGINEFPEPVQIEASPLPRRDFLRMAGFSFAGAALTGCQQTPVQKAIPYLVKPEELIPGRALYYASTCGGCSAGCGLVVKNRDGRPIKLEGNPDHPLSRGGLCAVGQASILGFYDSHRLRQPFREGKAASWEEVDQEIVEHLERIRNEGGAVRFLTGTVNSPTLLASIDAFLGRFSDARHVVYDALSSSAIREAHERTHGVAVLPRYRFDRADVILSLDADFLGTWISPVEHTSGYQMMRDLECGVVAPSYHMQCESRLSLTGTKADQRIRVAPGEMGLLVTHLAARLAGLSGAPLETGTLEPCPIAPEILEEMARRLWEARGNSLVVSGRQEVATQMLCNYVNHLLGNYGSTIDVARPSHQRNGDDRELEKLLEELRTGKVAALLVYGVNPVYELPNGNALQESISRVPLVVSLAERRDETAEAARFVCPIQDDLETWGDSEAVEGIIGLRQPCIAPLGDARAVMEIVSAWTGEHAPAYDTMREHWRAHIFPRQAQETSFQAFWDRTVHDGFVELPDTGGETEPSFDVTAVEPVRSAAEGGKDELTLVLYPKVGMLDGRHAYNPWLQELPDPVTKVTWDNYVCMSPVTAEKHGIEDGDVVRLEATGDVPVEPLELPAVIQPGQHEGVVAVALGYGSKAGERFAGIGPQWLQARSTVGKHGRVGVNVAPYLRLSQGALEYDQHRVRLQRTGERQPLASTQLHHSIHVPEHLATPGAERRSVVQEISLREYREGLCSDAEPEHGAEHHADLWPPDHEYPGRRWAMAIDLNACTGCSACVIACQAENNVPVVGKDEVHRQREMHWIRIDRYYSGEGDDVEVAHQPMLCQHCENAPCETVCPVLATVHSEEGLNEQIYNRCVGTRYCANNCPYKVRRFNWFDYAHEDRLQNMVLNPDVTVRSRGVMEKCSFCVQRIQEAKIEAKRQGQEVKDGDVQPACQQTCPASAIVFGDMNDPSSQVSQRLASPRRYQVLEEINVKPVVNYLRLVRRDEEEGRENG